MVNWKFSQIFFRDSFPLLSLIQENLQYKGLPSVVNRTTGNEKRIFRSMIQEIQREIPFFPEMALENEKEE